MARKVPPRKRGDKIRATAVRADPVMNWVRGVLFPWENLLYCDDASRVLGVKPDTLRKAAQDGLVETYFAKDGWKYDLRTYKYPIVKSGSTKGLRPISTPTPGKTIVKVWFGNKHAIAEVLKKNKSEATVMFLQELSKGKKTIQPGVKMKVPTDCLDEIQDFARYIATYSIDEESE